MRSSQLAGSSGLRLRPSAAEIASGWLMMRAELRFACGGDLGRGGFSHDVEPFFHPGLESAREIRDVVDSVGLEKARGDRRTSTALAVHHDGLGRVELCE